MKTTNLNYSSGYDVEQVKPAVDRILESLANVDENIVNVILLTAVLENSKKTAEASKEYADMIAKGETTVWGGGGAKVGAGDYTIEIKMSLSEDAYFDALIKELLQNELSSVDEVMRKLLKDRDTKH